jgi:hypothetical protein
MVITTRVSVFWPAIRNVTILPTARWGGGDACVWLKGKKEIILIRYSPIRLHHLAEILTHSHLSIFHNKEEAYGRNV